MTAIALFLPFILYTLFIFYLFDRIVKFEYENYKKRWIADGKPIGFFWVPEEARSEFLRLPKITGSFARSRCCFRWNFITPEWVKGDRQAAKILRLYRISCALIYLVPLAWIIYTLSG